MPFYKGHPGYKTNLGKHWSKEIRERISKKLKGRSLPEETKVKMSISRIGKPQPWHLGKSLPLEQRLKMGRKKELHWNWQGGISVLNARRDSWECKVWRLEVYKKDNYTCQICGARNCPGRRITLNADHIRPWAKYPELRFDLNNGRTLCVECHRKTPTYSVKKVYE